MSSAKQQLMDWGMPGLPVSNTCSRPVSVVQEVDYVIGECESCGAPARRDSHECEYCGRCPVSLMLHPMTTPGCRKQLSRLRR